MFSLGHGSKIGVGGGGGSRVHQMRGANGVVSGNPIHLELPRGQVGVDGCPVLEGPAFAPQDALDKQDPGQGVPDSLVDYERKSHDVRASVGRSPGALLLLLLLMFRSAALRVIEQSGAEDHCPVAVGLKVDADVELDGLGVEVLHPRLGHGGLDAEALPEEPSRGAVGVGGLDDPEGEALAAGEGRQGVLAGQQEEGVKRQGAPQRMEVGK